MNGHKAVVLSGLEITIGVRSLQIADSDEIQAEYDCLIT
jgi:hypothetical protein